MSEPTRIEVVMSPEVARRIVVSDDQMWAIGHPDPANAKVGDEVTIRAVKLGRRVPVSTEAALMFGLVTEEQAREAGWTPPPPIPRLRRWRWAVRSWWWDHKPHIHLGPCNHGDCI